MTDERALVEHEREAFQSSKSRVREDCDGDLAEIRAGQHIPATNDWHDELIKNPNTGALVRCEANVALFIENDPELGVLVAYDEMADVVILQRKPPWADLGNKMYPRQWLDTDDTSLAIHLQGKGLNAPPAMIARLVSLAASNNRCNPLTDQLESFVWDQTPRISSWLSDYLGAQDTPLTRSWGRCFLIGAIARAFDPGCQMDSMLVIEGVQGLKKTTLIKDLGLGFTGELSGDVTSRRKEAVENMRGCWLVEKAEMASIKGKAAESVKAFITATEDQFRPAYGSRSITVKRRQVFIGTTNTDDYLSDPTGNRRFWPVMATKADVDGIRRNRDQLWAEAIVAYHNQEHWWLSPELELASVDEQDARVFDDVWQDHITAYITAHKYQAVTIKQLLHEIAELLGENRAASRADQMRLADVLKRIGFQKSNLRFNGQQGRPPLWVHRDEVTRLGLSHAQELKARFVAPDAWCDTGITNIWCDVDGYYTK
jgi:putative DNA primase/helicase